MRQTVVEQLVKLLLGIVGLVLSQQGAPQNDVAFLQLRRRCQQLPRERFGFAVIQRAVQSIRFSQRYGDVRRLGRDIVGVVKLWIKLFRIDFNVERCREHS